MADGWHPRWEDDWERAQELGLHPSRPIREDERRGICEAHLPGRTCPNHPTTVFTYPDGTDVHACDVHRPGVAALVESVAELRRMNSVPGRVTFRRLRNREYMEKLTTLRES